MKSLKRYAPVMLAAAVVAVSSSVAQAQTTALDISSDLEAGITAANGYIVVAVGAAVLAIAARIGMKWLRRAG